ncbi:MAG: nucleoside deaminase [Gammaproteobacteria bacterium]|nr:nucleoside deaminase [Gammaproteobacteria bacterium]MDH3468094.1 nucleoside deaminase [Gammaproteobacteria bacterium]
MHKHIDGDHNFNRRTLLRSLGLLPGFAVPLVYAAESSEPIAQPTDTTPQGFMQRAFEMQELAIQTGDQGYGAMLVRDGRVVGEAPSRVIVNGDPTAHAEIEAIRDTARRLGTRNLQGCVMYSSSPPCPMCEAAAYWAGVDRLVYSHDVTDGGAPRLSRC